MNTVTWNDDFKSATDILTGNKDVKQQVVKLLKEALAAPLFIYEDPILDWSKEDAPMAFDSWNMPIFPFKSFRMDLKSEFQALDGVATICAKIIVFGDQSWSGGRLFLMALLPTKSEVKNKPFKLGNQEKIIFLPVISSNGNNRWKAALDAMSLERRTVISGSEFTPNLREFSRLIVDRVYESLHRFSVDFINPNLHLVNVSQKCGEARSVEWLKSREHYIFVHKNSPINNAGSSGKKFNHDAEIERSSHSRRAHYRLLKSPRFKAKRGTLVLVRSCWVGPKEWEDSTGQIYKIVEHPKQANREPISRN